MRNPAKLLQMKRKFDAFAGRHPKFLRYLAYITDNYMAEGAVLDVTVTDAEGKSIHGNARLTAEDVAFLKEVKAFLDGKD